MLESIINKTILIYKENEIGLFHKKELTISFSKIENENGKLKVDNGYIKSKSTADYYGIYKGFFVAFEAKSTQLDYLPISNIKEHQYNYLIEVSKYGGLGFIIILFASYDEFYVINVNQVNFSSKKVTKEYCAQKGIRLELTYPGIIDFAHAFDRLK